MDSIIAHPILPMWDFDNPELLIKQIEAEILGFAVDMKTFLDL